ncbi:MAG: OB-fold nucleic acid binding domain-containing protein, partial [Cyanobacteria bacterium P01_A01_bin.17]
MRTHYCGELRGDHSGQTVTLFGWIDRRRDHGGVIFLDLRDRNGIVQIVSDPERTPETYSLAEDMRNEYVIKVQGRVSPRPEESLNPNLPTGEIEIYANQLELLNPIQKQMPFQVAAADTESVKEELRLTYRYLDLRRDR